MSEAQAAPEKLRQRLETASWFAVVRAYLECSRRYGRMLQQFDLTVSQFDVLSAISALQEDALPKAIAHRLVVTRANISGVLQRLGERGLIETCRHSADGRSYVCSLTPAGEQLFEASRAAAGRFVSAQLGPFADAELQQLTGMMRQMHAHLQTLDPAALASPDPV